MRLKLTANMSGPAATTGSIGDGTDASGSKRPSWVLLLNIALFLSSVITGVVLLEDGAHREVGGVVLTFGIVIALRRGTIMLYAADAGDDHTSSRRPMLTAKQQSGTALLTTSGVVLGLIAFDGSLPGDAFKMAACALAATIAIAIVHLDIVQGLLLSSAPGPNARRVELMLNQAMQMTFLFGLISVVAGVVTK